VGTSRLGERPGVQDRSRGEREDEYDFEFAAKRCGIIGTQDASSNTSIGNTIPAS